MKARHELHQVHDRDLVRWATEKADELQLQGFRASSHWIFDWKKDHRVVRRKINKHFTRKDLDAQPKVIESIDEFVNRIRSMRAIPNPPKLFNADQTGMQMELKPNFTLETAGTRYVQEKIDSKSATTHSITLFPFFGHDGYCVLPILIILQEPKGVFGPRVQNTMYTHPDLLIECSKSGKITKQILARWYREVLFKDRNLHNGILLLDSLPMHKDKEFAFSFKPDDFNIAIEIIPPGTTDKIQPMDRDLNRILKAFTKELSLGFCSNDPRIERTNISTRDNICFIYVHVFNQVRSPRFKGWVQRTFKICGYIDTYEPYPGSPIEYCFDRNEVPTSPCSLCEEFKGAFIRCAWCKLLFCAYHYFFSERSHYCKQYIP